MSQTVNYQAFYDFALQKSEKEPTITVVELLKQFQVQNEVHVSELDLAIYELEKNGHLNDSIQADAQKKTLGTSF